jgi:hypothetical protein
MIDPEAWPAPDLGAVPAPDAKGTDHSMPNEQFTHVTRLEDIARHLRAWHAALRSSVDAGAAPGAGVSRLMRPLWCKALVSIEPSTGSVDKAVFSRDVHPQDHFNIVEFNPPNEEAEDPRPHTAIAVDEQQRFHLFHSDELQDNGRGRVDAARFQEATGTSPLPGIGFYGRGWHYVARLTGPQGKARDAQRIQLETEKFFLLCLLARGCPYDGMSAGIPDLNYMLPPRDEVRVRRRQLTVVRELVRILRRGRISNPPVIKTEIPALCPVDLYVQAPAPTIVEVKTDIIPYDIYTAIGQLMTQRILHRELLGDCRMVMLLPERQRDHRLDDAVKACNITIATYRYRERGGQADAEVTFPSSTLRLLGIDIGD